MWYLGAVLFVGTAGAGAYQILSRHHAQFAEAVARSPDSGRPQATAAAEPVAPGNSLPEAAPFPTANGPSSAASATPHQRAAASPPLLVPPLHPHLAAVTPLRPHLATTGTGHVFHSYRLADRRPATLALTARPTHRTAAQTLTVLRQAPPLLASQYAAPSRPAWVYAQPPAPSVTYYPYPGYPAYQPGYDYYYRRYQYYRVY
jgi:hypothetical protein